MHDPTDRPPPIWTLDGRDNVLLAVASRYFKMSSEESQQQIVATHSALVDILHTKGIDYLDLQAPLSPSRDRHEVALLFRVDRCPGWNYAISAASLVIPNLDRRSKHSFLAGDLLGASQARMRELLSEVIVPPSNDSEPNLDFKAVIFAIYLNNLTAAMLRKIHENLSFTGAYCGYIPCDLSSPQRDYLSAVLTPQYVKCSDSVICLNEDDVPLGEDQNLPSWPWGEAGYVVRSVPLVYFQLFLGYKIERAVSTDPDREDTWYSLNAISARPAPIKELAIEIEPSRLDYIVDEKAGSLEALGLTGISLNDLRRLLTSKLEQSYIYRLEYMQQYRVSKFNIVVEVTSPKTGTTRKALAAFKYHDLHHIAELVTFF